MVNQPPSDSNEFIQIIGELLDELEIAELRQLVAIAKDYKDFDWERFGERMGRHWNKVINEVGSTEAVKFKRGMMKALGD